jgi:ectoine hydroxylase-related dioxygenase (phytanoyl-CoA dioxygenase family)
MVAIDATDEANGSLEMIPGLHREGLLGQMWAPLTDADTAGRAYVPVHCRRGDAVFFDSYTPHRSGANQSQLARRVLYITYNKASEGDHRARYYADKRKSYPPDIEREAGKDYAFKV